MRRERLCIRLGLRKRRSTTQKSPEERKSNLWNKTLRLSRRSGCLDCWSLSSTSLSLRLLRASLSREVTHGNIAQSGHSWKPTSRWATVIVYMNGSSNPRACTDKPKALFWGTTFSVWWKSGRKANILSCALLVFCYCCLVWPCHLQIDGDVYDVTKGNAYQPGGSYHILYAYPL